MAQSTLKVPILVHSWNTGGEPELITVLHTGCMHVHRRKQFTILQLVQLSSVKSSLSFTPYDVYSSQSTLLVGGTLQTGNAHVVALSAL